MCARVKKTEKKQRKAWMRKRSLISVDGDVEMSQGVDNVPNPPERFLLKLP